MAFSTQSNFYDIKTPFLKYIERNEINLNEILKHNDFTAAEFDKCPDSRAWSLDQHKRSQFYLELLDKTDFIRKTDCIEKSSNDTLNDLKKEISEKNKEILKYQDILKNYETQIEDLENKNREIEQLKDEIKNRIPEIMESDLNDEKKDENEFLKKIKDLEEELNFYKNQTNIDNVPQSNINEELQKKVIDLEKKLENYSKQDENYKSSPIIDKIFHEKSTETENEPITIISNDASANDLVHDLQEKYDSLKRDYDKLTHEHENILANTTPGYSEELEAIRNDRDRLQDHMNDVNNEIAIFMNILCDYKRLYDRFCLKCHECDEVNSENCRLSTIITELEQSINDVNNRFLCEKNLKEDYEVKEKSRIDGNIKRKGKNSYQFLRKQSASMRKLNSKVFIRTELTINYTDWN